MSTLPPNFRQQFLSGPRCLALLLCLYCLLSLYGLGSWGLIETSEARYAEMGREMYLSGDVLHPTILGVRHYHKPPLTYAITAFAYQVFGVSTWSARIFLQIGLWLQLLLVYRIGRLLLPERRTALWATAIFASFPILLIASRNLTTDLYLNTFLLGGVWAFLRSERGSRPVGWLLLAYAIWGLAALTKGAGVVILPAVLLPAWYLLHPPAGWWRLIGRHLLGAAIFLPIGLSWYLALIAEDGALLHYFLVEQTIQRYTNDQWSRNQPVWYYLATVTATTLPWLFAVLAHGRHWRPNSNTWWFAAWFFVPIAFYSFAQSKLILYVLPAYAGLAFLGAQWLGAASAGAVDRWKRIAQWFFSLVFVALLLAPWVGLGVNASVPYFLWGMAGLIALWVLPSRMHGLTPNGAERLVAVALLFPVVLLPTGTEFLAHNELLVNSPAPLTDRLREEGLADHDVYSLERELPAVAFGLQTPLNELYRGDMPRDTSRETNLAWHLRWYDIDEAAVRDSLSRRWAERPTVVVAYRKPRGTLRRWLQGLGQHDSIGRYTYYYNQPQPTGAGKP